MTPCLHSVVFILYSQQEHYYSPPKYSVRYVLLSLDPAIYGNSSRTPTAILIRLATSSISNKYTHTYEPMYYYGVLCSSTLRPDDQVTEAKQLGARWATSNLAHWAVGSLSTAGMKVEDFFQSLKLEPGCSQCTAATACRPKGYWVCVTQQ